MKILIAEDSELNFEMLAACLGVGVHDVSWARGGEEAIGELATGKFDLLLLDLHMPRVDGFTVLRWLKDRESSGMKVIVLTADDAVREETMALGADAFLTKPLDLKQLSAAIKVVTGIAAGCGGWPEEPS
jgi:two-component system OmpR family response regulator/two-component system response regulator QseB